MKRRRMYWYFTQLEEYVNLNIGNGHLINVNDLSNHLNISYTYLYKICKSIKNCAPHKLIDEKYGQQAIIYYFQDFMDAKLIADKLGFSSVSSFCHFFKRCTGKNLSDYFTELDLSIEPFNYYPKINQVL